MQAECCLLDSLSRTLQKRKHILVNRIVFLSGAFSGALLYVNLSNLKCESIAKEEIDSMAPCLAVLRMGHFISNV